MRKHYARSSSGACSAEGMNADLLIGSETTLTHRSSHVHTSTNSLSAAIPFLITSSATLPFIRAFKTDKDTVNEIYPLASTGLQQYSHGMYSIIPGVQSSSEYNDLSFIPSRKRSFNHSIFSGYPTLFIFLYPQTHIQGYCLHSYQQSLFLPLFIPPINPVAEDLWLCLLMWLRLSPNVSRVYDVITGATNGRGAYTRCCAMEQAITSQQ